MQTFVRRQQRLGTEEGNDVPPASAPVGTGGHHQVLLGLEQDFGGPLNGAIDAEFLRVASVQLTKQMHDAPPDVRGNQLDLAEPALFNSIEQLVGFAQLIARSASGAALPGPEAMLGNFQNGALDHDLSSHDSP